MKFRFFGSIVGMLVLAISQPASALPYLSGTFVTWSLATYVLPAQDEVRSRSLASKTIVDEVDKIDIDLTLYFSGILFDVELDHDHKTCLGPGDVQCGPATTSHTPLSAGCKYCGDVLIQTFRNNESDPSLPPVYVEVAHIPSTLCDTAPTGGGGPGGGGEIP